MQRPFAIGLLVVLSVGCATRVTMVAAGTVVSQNRDRLVPGASLSVVVDAEAEPQPLYRDLARGIETTLRVSGFRIGPEDESDLLVFFRFGTRKSLKPGVEAHWTVMDERPPSASSRDVFNHYFRVVVLEAEPYRHDRTVSVVWTGYAVLTKRLSSNPGESDAQALLILDFLREGALEFFGQDQKPTAIGQFVPGSGKRADPR